MNGWIDGGMNGWGHGWLDGLWNGWITVWMS
jgi:hypothetical protein